MKARQGFTVWTVVVFCCLFEISQASQCNYCDNTVGFTVTTTSIKTTEQNCTLSINGESYKSDAPNLEPGGVYAVYADCFNCCFTATTEPEHVSILNTESTTSSLSLNWDKPSGNVSGYYVEWTGEGENGNTSALNTSVEIPGLTSGVQYNITVFALAGDRRTKGKGSTKSIYTRPMMPADVTVNHRDTNSLNISWTLPAGRVDHYEVQLNQMKEQTDTTMVQFSGLSPGQLYTVTVTAVAGSFSNSSASEFATYPLPPQSVTIAGRTNSSLDLRWDVNTKMRDAPNINYSISYDGFNLKPTVRNVALPHLQSGFYYDITVKTVGPQDLHSTGVNIRACTNPNPVSHLQAFPESTTSLKVEWSYPSDHNQNYSYSIFIYDATGTFVRNESLQSNSTSLTELEPGSKYIIAVTTLLTEECQSTKENVSSYTKPAAATITKVSGSTSDLTVSWDKAEGGVDNYAVTLYNSNVPVKTTGPLSNNTSSTTFTNLKPGVLYCAIVVTKSGPLQTNSTETCNATFPNPPRNIVVKSQTERSILFSWDDPEEMQPDQNFTVTTFNGENIETKNKIFELNDLQPGNPYFISVATVGVNNYMSEKVHKEAFTKPAAVNITEISGSTTDLTVSWDKAEGGVENYRVTLYNSIGPVKTTGPLSNNTSNTTFTDLKPGVLYCAIVVTHSGPLQTNSTESCNATFPNPPRNLRVSLQTVESITFTWDSPEDMQPHQYHFIVDITNRSTVTQNHTEITVKSLESGSPYTITVVTVGVNDLKSQKVTTEAYPRPYPVTDLQQTEITPDSVTLTWNQTGYRPDYRYVVEVSNISGPISAPANVTSLTYKAQGLISGTNYSFTVTTQTADGTAASPVTVSYFTRPYGIKNLEADTLNTTSVNLTWKQPSQYKPEYTYVVKTSGCSETYNKTVISENTELTGLNPGTNCSFCVTVKAENGIESESDCTSAYTMPEKVVPHITSQGLNSSMFVSWAKPRGNVEVYTVYLNGTNGTSVKLNSTAQSYKFTGLSAGRNYTAVVETQSGNFSVQSESVTNATFPNPPGVITVLNKTTSSIHVSWEEAPLMTGAQFHYQVEISPNGNDRTTQTNYPFGELLSGTSYNVTVTTVAAMGFRSETVRRYMITTRPFPVKNLQADPGEDSVVLTWDKPDQYKNSYKFNVLDSSGKNVTENSFTHTLTGLDSGSSYWFTVTTKTSDGTAGEPVNITKCTDASSVKSIICEAPNEPNATITWTWETAKGRFSNFSVEFGKETPGTVKSCCNFVKGDLKHYTNYTVKVTTQSCGKSSAPVSHSCQTGITDPPAPKNYESMLRLDNVKFNEFSIIVSLDLLNNINGPIRNVGVLVSETKPADNKPEVTTYLGSTYDKWKNKEADAYLATVIDVKDVTVRTSDTGSLILHVGDETTWHSYGNGVLEPTKQYMYAIVLFTSLTVNNQGIISAQSTLFSYTEFDNIVKLPQNPVVIGMAVGVTLAIFSVLLIVLIGFIIYWRRLSNKESSDIQIHSLRANVSLPVRVEDYEGYYKKQKADSNCGFAEEYEDLKVVGTAQSKISALTPENKPKNRYNNVLPYDASRVKLSIIHGNPIDDYINANYIPGYNSRKEFIAAQGPLPATVNDFWRMIWEKNVHTVVMLTRCNEQGRVKCEQYWTPGTKHYGNITVTTTSEIPLEDWTIRDFDIKNVKTAETRSVRHFHFTAWPDHGVPETTELLISFRHLVREHMDQYRHSPTVVHCSAGVGRTGTFIAIDRLIFQIERENVVDIYGIVHDMRMHRVLMVQTEDQYVFLNQCALDVIRSRTGNNVDLIYQNTAAFAIYENVESFELQKRNQK